MTVTLGPELFERLHREQWGGTMEPAVYGPGGLSTSDIEKLQSQLGFPLPEDFCYFLQNVIDPGEVLFDYHNFNKQHYDSSIAWILHGMIFDIEKNNLWLRRWGNKPVDLKSKIEIARADFPSWPKLLPIHGHRYLAAEPCRAGNPVFSIMQTDIIYYGANLAHYLVNEFLDHDHDKHTYAQPIEKIPIWSDFVDNRESFLTEGFFFH
jgi:hypothetical protein